MGLLTNLVRFVGKQSISKEDLETNYGAVTALVGGSYYSGGVSASGSGTLDNQNFRANAGITNAFKYEPYSLVTVPLYFGQIADTATQSSYFIAPTAMKFVNGQVVFQGGDGSATIVVNFYKNGSAETPSGNLTLRIPLRTGTTGLANTSDLAAGDIFEVTVTASAGGGSPYTNVKVDLQFKILHSAD